MTRFGPRRRLAGLAALVALSSTACSVSLDKLPLPAPGVGADSYSLTATFGNALNLPTKAKVRLNGADIGEVESMQAKNYTAVVHMRIKAGVLLPAGTSAELRSATPMGDVFVALTPPAHPAPDAPRLADGASIPEESTAAATTIEEVLSRAALLVNGGAIENITTLANSLGEAVGGRGDRLATMIQQTRQLVDSLLARTDQIRRVLATTKDLSATLAAHRSDVDAAVAAAGPAVQVIGDNTQQIVDLVGQLNRISQQLSQYPSVKGTNNLSLIKSINLMAANMNAAANNPKANLDPLIGILPIVVKVTDAQSAHVNVDIVRLAIGATPDIHSPGDAGSTLPTPTDWTNFVGSLEYTLSRLRGRLTVPGQAPPPAPGQVAVPEQPTLPGLTLPGLPGSAMQHRRKGLILT